MSPSSRTKSLIIRLSSLGDVILATAALSHPSLSKSTVDWVVSKEYAELLRGHPRVGKIWEFDRESGFKGWLELCRQLASEGYDDIYDLHSTVRSKVARWYLRWKGPRGRTSWHLLKKSRWRAYGLLLMKSNWPEALLPHAFFKRFARMMGPSINTAHPDLSHLLGESNAKEELGSEDYYCVMPASKWAGKCWQVDNYFELIRSLSRKGNSLGCPVVMGSNSDAPSVELVRRLKKEGIRHHSGVGRWNLRETAQILSGATRYLGNDTGLAHLSEAVGTPALVIFGPTTPELGFGPWRPQSIAVGSSLWCRPCSRDGSRCFRPFNRFLCMTSLHPQTVLKELEDSTQGGKSQ